MGIEVTWKPVLWYVKEAYPQGRGFIVDSFVVSGKSGQTKDNHKWEQDASWSDFFIGKLTRGIDDVVLDPMVGSGTAAVSAKKLGRRCIGIDISEDYCAVAAARCVATVAGVVV